MHDFTLISLFVMDELACGIISDYFNDTCSCRKFNTNAKSDHTFREIRLTISRQLRFKIFAMPCIYFEAETVNFIYFSHFFQLVNKYR